MDREKWYRLRNDRINRVDGVNLDEASKKSVGVIVNSKHLDHYSMQVMTYISLNMLSRWCPSFSVDLPDDIQCTIPGLREKKLKEVVLELVQKNDPFGEFAVNNISPSDYDIVLYIGECCHAEESNIIWIDAEGWLAGYGQNKNGNIDVRNKNDKNPIGPSFAACLGVSEVFKKYLGIQDSESFSQWYSIYDLQSDSNYVTLPNPPMPRLLEVGTLYQIGCGAVGSSLDLLFSFLNIKGEIHLIDYDSVSVPNTASSMLFAAKDGIVEKDKVDICYNVLEKVDMFKAYPHKCDYSTFIKKHNGINGNPDSVLCLANEKNIWSTIQHNYPPLVLHATTSPNWGVNLGRHIPFKDWCIVCRFGVEEYEAVPVCSQAKINSGKEGEEILGILPFLSAAGATLILSEILRSKIGGYKKSNENFAQFSFRDANVDFLKVKMSRNEDCPVCNNQTKEEYSYLKTHMSNNQSHEDK